MQNVQKSSAALHPLSRFREKVPKTKRNTKKKIRKEKKAKTTLKGKHVPIVLEGYRHSAMPYRVKRWWEIISQ